MEMPRNEEVEEVDTALANAQGMSLLKSAQKRREERETTLFLDVPTWDGDMVCEYKVVHPDELRKIAESAMRRARHANNGSSPEAGANDIALILAATVGLYMVNPDTGERVPIEDEHGHVGYNRIAAMLGKEDIIKSNAEAVKYLMSEHEENEEDYTPNIVAISLHASNISKWTKDPSKRGVDLEELLGEF